MFEPTCYITSRPVSTEITKQWIEKNGFPCVPIYTVDVNHSKIQVAKEAGIEVFIDDKFENFVELNNAGIKNKKGYLKIKVSYIFLYINY